MHMNWHPSVRGPIAELNAGMEGDLCGLTTERPRWDIPAAVLSHSKRMTTGLALQAAFQHLFNLGLLSPSFLGSSIESSRFASLCLSLRQ